MQFFIAVVQLLCDIVCRASVNKHVYIVLIKIRCPHNFSRVINTLDNLSCIQYLLPEKRDLETSQSLRNPPDSGYTEHGLRN